MDEFLLCSLIAEGENESVEFKRKVHVQSQEQKAEFVKDVIALANSAPDVSRMLVGVDDDGLIVGADEPEVEQMQQIIGTYASPPIVLQCEMVPIQHPSLLLVAVISVCRTRRPHMVSRAVGRLEKDDVFVRRGKVVTKASPDEILGMYEADTLIRREARQYTRAAEKHMELQNWQTAVEAYSKAIVSCPTAELFFKRGQAYEVCAQYSRKPAGMTEEQWHNHPMNPRALEALADKDYADAIKLDPASETEKQARLGRVRLAIQPWEEWSEEVAWLKEHTLGRQRGEALYWEVHRWDVISDESVAPDAIARLTEAIELGFQEPGVYDLRSWAQSGLHNYGLALQDIDEAISRFKLGSTYDLWDCLELKAGILVKIGKPLEAHKALLEARKKLGKAIPAGRILIGYGLEKDIVLRYALAYDLDKESVPQHVKAMLRVLALYLDGVRTFLRADSGRRLRIGSLMEALEMEMPGIRRVVERLIGTTW